MTCPPNLIFAPIDFERETLGEGLGTAGFDFDAPTVFAWIGVTMFLSLEAISSTLGLIAACAAGTRVVLTYNQPQAALDGLGAQTQAAIARIAAGMDERELTGFYVTRNPDGTRPRLLFQRREKSRPELYPIHLDLLAEDREAEIELLTRAGASVVATKTAGDRTWTIMRDPEANPFCVE